MLCICGAFVKAAASRRSLDTSYRKPQSEILLSQTELFNNRTVAVDIFLLQISQQVAAMTNHLQHTSAGVEILLVYLQMLGKGFDSVGQNCNLHFRGSGVALMHLVLFDNFVLFFFSDHFSSPHIIFAVAFLRRRQVKDPL